MANRTARHTTSSSSGWATVSIAGSLCDSSSGGKQTWTIQHAKTGQERSFLVYLPDSIRSSSSSICDTGTSKTHPDAQENGEHDTNTGRMIYPIMLAFHGFGGHPQTEISKWKSTAEQQELILVAPEGSSSRHNANQQPLGWNAIDCCGDPVASKTDDLDFSRGIVEAIRQNNDMAAVADASNVVAAGWSNGGFLVSLLALQTKEQRPPWLKG
eukprot:scaffold132989_cov47-Attheya_sp.AAC.1